MMNSIVKLTVKLTCATVVGTIATIACAGSAQAFSFKVTQGNTNLGASMNQSGGYSEFHGLNGFMNVDFNDGTAPTTGPVQYSFQNSGSSVRDDQWAATAHTGERNNSKYLAVFNGSDVTINLASKFNYFGINWGAISDNNTFTFYRGNKLVKSFNTQDINPLATVTAGHQNNERNAYVHFYADRDSEVFDRIVVSQASTAGGGFESDNHSFRMGSRGFDWETGKEKTPEPAAMLGLAVVGGAAWVKRQRSRKG
jgi:hypothetical protein